jgi:hypothetical protein
MTTCRRSSSTSESYSSAGCSLSSRSALRIPPRQQLMCVATMLCCARLSVRGAYASRSGRLCSPEISNTLVISNFYSSGLEAHQHETGSVKLTCGFLDGGTPARARYGESAAASKASADGKDAATTATDAYTTLSARFEPGRAWVVPASLSPQIWRLAP